MHEDFIAASALRHGYSEEDIWHAVRNHADSFGLEDGLTMVVGPARNGDLVEVGLIVSNDGARVVIHCMAVRKKFLR